jgi:hypothetical protein
LEEASRVSAFPFSPGLPELLFEGSYVDQTDTGLSSIYDVTADGQRFVMLQPTEASDRGRIIVVLNWFEELKRLVPVN